MRSRRTVLVSAVLFSVSLAVAGCGSEGVRTGSGEPAGLAGPSGKELLVTGDTGRPEGAAARRAAEVAKAWTGSAAERAWRNGYRPLDRTEWLPPNAFRNGEDKVAFGSGHLDLATPLPAAAPQGKVTWSDGSAVTRPLLTARQVFDGLTSSKGKSECEGKGCDRRLRVTGAKAATRTLATSRGQATIPVWEFTIEGYAEPFAYPAVAPDEPPTGQHGGHPLPEIKGMSQAADWHKTSADRRVLTARVLHGSCDDVLPGQVYETNDVVVLIGRTGPWKAAMCNAALRATPAEFRLARPLGSRTLLDALSGDPMAQQMIPGTAQ